MKALFAIRTLVADWFAAAWHIVRFAPWLLLPILLTEGAQHIAEIQLGMFASRDAFTSLANDATRWGFGYAKIAGLLISMLIVARAAALGSASRALIPHWRSLVTLLALTALTFALDWGFKSDAALALAPDLLLQSINMILQSALTILILAALFEDRWAMLRAARWRAIGAFLLSGLLAAVAMLPMQLVHGLNHTRALGAAPALVWALMIFDTLWTAGIALMVGTGMAIGWRRFIPALQARKSAVPADLRPKKWATQGVAQ